MTENINKQKETIRGMFNNIAHRYDFLNHLLSFGIDRCWRTKVIKLIKKNLEKNLHPVILDVATGTADLAISAVSLNPEKIIGIDISEEMLNVAKKKILKKNLNHLIEFEIAEAESIPFSDNKFDATMVAFGVRNFYDTAKGLQEMLRILKPGGIAVILEFSQPKVFPVKQIYAFYFKHILPFVGRFFSKDISAYNYLPDSVYQFAEGDEFLLIMKDAGFNHVQKKPLLFGISTIYSGKK